MGRGGGVSVRWWRDRCRLIMDRSDKFFGSFRVFPSLFVRNFKPVVLW